jgi:hypothetical protein
MVVSAIAGRLEVLALSARGLKKIEDEMVSEARQHSLITSALPSLASAISKDGSVDIEVADRRLVGS